MFKRSTERRPADSWMEGLAEETCPKCGYTEVLFDTCPRCRVRVSTYRAYLAGLDQKVQPSPVSHPGTWLGRLRRAKTFKKLLMIVPGSRSSAVRSDWRSKYEQLVLTRIYRELQYPKSTRGIYLALLAFGVTLAGRLEGVRLAVYPPHRDVDASVRDAISRAEPFPLPPADADGNRDQRFSLALTISL